MAEGFGFRVRRSLAYAIGMCMRFRDQGGRCRAVGVYNEYGSDCEEL